MNLSRPTKIAVGLVVTALLLLAPFAVYANFLCQLLCFALFASAFNLLLGYVGLLAFGQTMFFGAAAYVTGYLVLESGASPELGILAGVGVAAVLGLATGFVAIRQKGIYFAMITLAVAQLVYFICLQLPQLNGENGLTGIPRQMLLGVLDLNNDLVLYYVVLAVCGGGISLLYRTIHSPVGQVLRAVRDNEARAISIGYDVDRYKLLAFVIAAACSGLAGSVKAIVVQVVTLTDVSWSTSGDVVLMTLVGGIGTVVGPLVGATVILTMQHYMEGIGSWVLTIQGLIFFCVTLVFRRGIVGETLVFLRERRGDTAPKLRPTRAVRSPPEI